MGSSNNSNSSSSSSSSSNTTITITTAKSNHFPSRLHDVLDTAEEKGYAHIISWYSNSNSDSDNGKAFKVHDPTSMIPILQSTFRQTKYKSFLRQLQSYGFERITKGDDIGMVSHPEFQRGKHDLCLQMKRKISRPASAGFSTSSSAMATAANTVMVANMNSPSNKSARAEELLAAMSHTTNANATIVTPIQQGSIVAVPPTASPVFIPAVISTMLIPEPPMSFSFEEYHSSYTIQALQQELKKRRQQEQEQEQQRQRQRQRQQQRQGGITFKREGSTTRAVLLPSTSSSFVLEQGSLLYSADSNPSSSSSVTVANLLTNQHPIHRKSIKFPPGLDLRNKQHLLSLLTNITDKAYLSPCCPNNNCAEICCRFSSTSATSSVTDTDIDSIIDNNNNVINNSSYICPSSMISSSSKLVSSTTDSNKRQRTTATAVSSFNKNNTTSLSFPLRPLLSEQ